MRTTHRLQKGVFTYSLSAHIKDNYGGISTNNIKHRYHIRPVNINNTMSKYLLITLHRGSLTNISFLEIHS